VEGKRLVYDLDLQEVKEEECEVKQVEIHYTILRRGEYPPLEQLADALVHQSLGDDSYLKEYIEKCRKVKEKYPKAGDKS